MGRESLGHCRCQVLVQAWNSNSWWMPKGSPRPERIVMAHFTIPAACCACLVQLLGGRCHCFERCWRKACRRKGAKGRDKGDASGLFRFHSVMVMSHYNAIQLIIYFCEVKSPSLWPMVWEEKPNFNILKRLDYTLESLTCTLGRQVPKAC